LEKQLKKRPIGYIKIKVWGPSGVVGVNKYEQIKRGATGKGEEWKRGGERRKTSKWGVDAETE